VARAAAAVYTSLAATKASLERVSPGPDRSLGHARFFADQAALSAIRTQVDLYRSRYGAWPASYEAVGALLNPPPRFQCAGNDYTYDPATGALALVVTDPSGC